MEPHVFIVGCARSGTTLLQRIVGSHPQIAVTPSIHWISDLLKEYGATKPEDPVPPDAIRTLSKNPRFRRFHIRREDLDKLAANNGTVTRTALLSAIFELYARYEGKPLVGNKTAPFVRRIHRLNTLWPRAKFVHIIRDGRDVSLSLMDWNSARGAAGRYATWEEDPVSTAALWWERKVRLGRESAKKIPSGLYREVRYESLVSNPSDVCRELCEFLEVPYDRAMLRFAERSYDPDFERDHPNTPVTTGLRDWRSQMSHESVERFEAISGDLLETLGYPLATRPPPKTFERAARIRNSFIQELRSKGRKLPKGWTS